MVDKVPLLLNDPSLVRKPLGSFGSPMCDNSAFVARELDLFTHFLNELGFGSENGLDTARFRDGDLDLPLPPLTNSDCSYPRFIRENRLSDLQRSILILTLLPELRPGILDQLFVFDKHIGKGMADFGGVRGKAFSGFIPTVETALFLFAGYDIRRRFEVLAEFYDEALLIRKRIITLESDNNEPFSSRKIEICRDVLAGITGTKLPSPQFSCDFPAKRLRSPLTWSDDPEKGDLVLNPYTRSHLGELINWIGHHNRLEGMKLTPGYRCLFYGPPGTGKTLTVTLIGQRYDMEVYRIDLSLMVSKYVGETQKNLEKVFAMAENRKDWILFFDEADSLFGKRTEVNSSNDKFANQETSFLLQRIEDFPGLVILATNFKENLDQAFIRRFQSIINFPMPNYEERLLLWKKALKKVSYSNTESDSSGAGQERYAFSYAEDIDIEAIARKVEISGAAIDNVIRYCVLNTFGGYFSDDRNKQKTDHCCIIGRTDLHKAIRREMNKEGRIV